MAIRYPQAQMGGPEVPRAIVMVDGLATASSDLVRDSTNPRRQPGVRNTGPGGPMMHSHSTTGRPPTDELEARIARLEFEHGVMRLWFADVEARLSALDAETG
jgi:hypothetical protein